MGLDAWLRKASAKVSNLMIECALPPAVLRDSGFPHLPVTVTNPRPPSRALMDGSCAGFHTSPSPPEAVTRVIGVTSADCMPSADKTVYNRELRVLPLIGGVRELLGTDPVWPQLSGGDPGRGSWPSWTRWEQMQRYPGLDLENVLESF